MAAAAPTYADSTRAAKTPEQIEALWRRRIQQAKAARKPYERIWLSNLAFAAGQQWLVWDQIAGQMRHIQDVDPRQRDRVLYTANRIREYLQAQLGELETGDDRPELVTAQDGDTAEEVAKELNAAVAYGWEHEWGASATLKKARRSVLTMGVSAIRSRFDPSKGPATSHQPVDAQGQPVTSETHPLDSLALEASGQMADGSLPQMRPVNEGRTTWEAFTGFQILPPPGVVHEDDFPWEILVRPVHLDEVKELYPKAAGLTEDGDIASASGLTTGQNTASTVAGTNTAATSESRLREHVWLYTCYLRPCASYPEGQVVTLASNSFRLLDVQEKLPNVGADGTRESGIRYFHWWRLDDRFWSQAFIEPLKDPQRALNEDKTIKRELMARGLPKVYLQKPLPDGNPTGAPFEAIIVGDQGAPPVIQQGIDPGTWWDLAMNEAEADLSHASTLSALRLGENPQNVDTYSQLALLNENESVKRDPIASDHRFQIRKLVEYGVHDIREWWPDKKTIYVSGDENTISQQIFRKQTVPDFFQVSAADGILPRSQAAQVKMIDAIWAAAQATGIITQDPDGWTNWYAESLKAGEPVELPEIQKDSQQELAAFENFLMLQGEQPEVAEYDLSPVHIPIHYEAEDQARAKGDMEAVARIRQHRADHISMVTGTRKAWRFFDPADTSDTASDAALDEDQTLRENQMLLQGVPLNPEAYAKAYAALQHGINPETQQPVQPTDDLQAILERASLQPTSVENFLMHMDRHGKVIKSGEFTQFPPDVRRRFLTHWDLTRTMWLSIPMMPEQIQSPKVSLQLREDVGPGTVAKVLRRAGVPEADPQELATEPPLPNIVQENLSPSGDAMRQPPTPPPAPGAKKPAAKPAAKKKPKK